MKNYKFSFIIPVYNVESYIEKCVDSILNQNYDNYEIIIVDDGSKDDSIKKIEKFSSPKIKIYNKKNGGLSSARNYGVKHATGDYIWFVDGDDYIENNSLYLLNKLLINQLYDVIVFNYATDNNGVIKKIKDKEPWDCKQRLPLLIGSACNKIYSLNFFRKNDFKFIEGKIYEDLELIPYLLVKANDIGFLNKYLYFYVQRDNSIMHQKSSFKNNRDDKFDILNSLFNRFKNDNIYNKYAEELEFLAIRHLIFVYSTEVLPFSSEIYKPRCKKAINYLSKLNINWYKNKYLKESTFDKKIYCMLFKNKFWFLCKLILKISNK